VIESHAKAGALLSALLFLGYFTLALESTQVIHTPFVFILTQLVQLESREYGLCQIMLYS